MPSNGTAELGIRVDSSEMAVFRAFTVATLAAVLAAAGGGFALADPPPWAHGHGHGHARTVDVAPGAPSHGVLSGVLVGVDYAMGSILVGTPRGVVPVAVTPTTSIFHGSRFASFADLARGARVTVDFSAIEGRLVAEIIRIR
jgi:hypothetical protein